jgi:hypothetical protein
MGIAFWYNGLSLAQLVRLLVVEPTPHLCSNSNFGMGIAFTSNYFFSGRWHHSWQRDTLDDGDSGISRSVGLVTMVTHESQDQSIQSFVYAHRVRLYIRAHKGECSCVYDYLCLYHVSKKVLVACARQCPCLIIYFLICYYIEILA